MERHAGREQALDDDVVEVAGDAVSIFEHGEAAPVCLRACVRERERRLQSMRLDHLPGLGRERVATEEVGDLQCPEHTAAGCDRDHHRVTEVPRRNERLTLALVLRRIGDERSLSRLHHVAGNRVGGGKPQPLLFGVRPFSRPDDEVVGLGRREHDRGEVGTGDLAHTADEPLQHLLVEISFRDHQVGDLRVLARSHCSRRLADSSRRAFSTTIPAAVARALMMRSSSSSKSRPSRFSDRYRLPNTSSRTRNGTPRNVLIGGWCSGKPIEWGSVVRSWSRSGSRLVDEEPQDAAALRQMPDGCNRVVVHADVDELREEPVRPDHAQRSVPCLGELDRRFDDMTEHYGQAQVGSDRDHGLEQTAQPVARGDHILQLPLQPAEQLVQAEVADATQHRAGTAGRALGLRLRRRLFGHGTQL